MAFGMVISESSFSYFIIILLVTPSFLESEFRENPFSSLFSFSFLPSTDAVRPAWLRLMNGNLLLTQLMKVPKLRVYMSNLEYTMFSSSLLPALSAMISGDAVIYDATDFISSVYSLLIEFASSRTLIKRICSFLLARMSKQVLVRFFMVNPFFRRKMFSLSRSACFILPHNILSFKKIVMNVY